MPAIEPLTTIPEIAKVGFMIYQVVELQSNGHKLATLKSAFANIAPLVEEADHLMPFQNSDVWVTIHKEVSMITTRYEKLLDRVRELNKAQRFIKFWEIRKEIRKLWNYIERTSFKIRKANISSKSKERELEQKRKHLSMLMAETETGMTASEALQQQIKVLDLQIKFEKALSDLVKVAKDMKSADDDDLQVHMVQRSFIAMSTVANMNGSTSLPDKKKFADMWLQECERGNASGLHHKEPRGNCPDIPADESSFVIGPEEEPSIDDISISATLNVNPDITVDGEESGSIS